ncbi:MAG: ATP synthase F1 subunit epsilon [Patescibacteria group bacterium]
MNTFQFDIITPQRKAFSDAVNSVSVPTSNGTIGVLSRHEELFTALTEGEVKVTMGTKEFFLSIGGGFMEVRDGVVTVLVSRAVHADEINEQEIKKAIEMASQLIARKSAQDERATALAMLRRSMLDLKVSHRRRGTSFSSYPIV